MPFAWPRQVNRDLVAEQSALSPEEREEQRADAFKKHRLRQAVRLWCSIAMRVDCLAPLDVLLAAVPNAC